MIVGMKWTKRSRRKNTERVLRYCKKERGLSDLDVAVDYPVFFDVIEEDGEFDFDDVVRMFDYLGYDVVAVPRGARAITEWFSLTDMPYDDGGKHRERDGVWMKRHRLGKEYGKTNGRGQGKGSRQI